MVSVTIFYIILPFYILSEASCTHINIFPNTNCTGFEDEQDGYNFPLSRLYTTNNDSLLLTSNTTITFLTGIHQLRSDIVIRDVEDLTIEFQEKSQLHCETRRGIVFVNVTNLNLYGLTLTNCGAEISEELIEEAIFVQTESILRIKRGLKSAIFMVNIRNLCMDHAKINGSHGYGFLGINIIGDSLVTNTQINSSNTNSLSDYDCTSRSKLEPSQAAKCHGGNALFLYNDYPTCPDIRARYSITIASSIFSHGVDLTENFDRYISQGYGLGVVASQIYYDIHIKLINDTFSNNMAKSFGSNLFIRLIFSETNSNVTIRDCHILFGRCTYCNIPRGVPYSSLVFLYGLRVPSSRGEYKRCSNLDEVIWSDSKAVSPMMMRAASKRRILLIENSRFAANHGGTIYIILFSSLTYTRTYTVLIRNCTLSRNEATKAGAMYIADISPRPENTNEMEMTVENTTFEHHVTLTEPYTDTQPNTNLLLSIKKFTFRGCTFMNNDGTAIVAHDTSLFFEGVNTFYSNRARLGAAVELTGVSIIYLRPNTHMIFKNNFALEKGGAMYLTGGSEESYFFDCQIQVFDPTFTKIPQLNITMVFVNNSAKDAGDALYGGRIDACYTSAPSQFLLQNRTLTTSSTFDTITDFKAQPATSSIVSSDAIRICFCFSGKHNCSIKQQMFSKYPGEKFEISIVGVGQRDGTVPTVVLAYSRTNVKFQNSSQQTGHTCTDTFYGVKSNSSNATNENLFLVPNAIRSNYPRPLRVIVDLLNCNTLTGFFHHRGKQICTCVPKLQERNITCDINTRMITRKPPYWLGNYSNDLLLHDNCPYDYCKTIPVQIVMSEPNISEQCAFDRYGTLCGSCREGFSHVFGSSRCLKCTNTHLLLIIPFALAGIVLVAFLLALNLTVSVGTINGLIFYANILKINEAIFFPPGDNSFFRVFISWLNLDLGIETCFYDGMTSLVKVSLQFVFPFYLWSIVGLTIVVFRHSTRLVKIVRLCGNHSVSVLATVFLLSCTKLQRSITSSLSLTTLQYPDGTRVLWLYDGNIQYAQKGHLALLLFSLFILLAVGFPYALLIFTVQFLRRYSNKWYLRWINKFMPIFDAYLGPYKPKQGYWTGLLIFIRVILVAVFAINVFGNPAIDIFIVTVVAILLLLFNLGQGGVYKRVCLTVLEISFILNLGLLAAATALARQINGKQQPSVVYTSTAIAVVTFVAILVYHVKLQATKWYTQWKRTNKQNKRRVLSSVDHENSFDNNSQKNFETTWKSVTTTVIDVFDVADTDTYS